ncbi:MAG TPA: agmatinase family protein [Cyclobacteriaceae bacterium]
MTKPISFDPNEVGRKGKIFGMPYEPEDAQLVLIPAPWEVTASYGSGTSKAPKAILDASSQLDLCIPGIKKPWQQKISMLPTEQKWLDLNNALRPKAIDHIKRSELGLSINNDQLEQINQGCSAFKEFIKAETKAWMDKGKLVGVVGGDHSICQGYVEAIAEKYKEFGILQIDAHMDLRTDYQGFKYSHASVFHNILKLDNVKKLIQLGVRDYCPAEEQTAQTDGRITSYHDLEIFERLFHDDLWADITEEITYHLPGNVYISFDIDGLEPVLAPNTGTPVPGGLKYAHVTFLLKKLVESGHTIIGFDLCEVVPSDQQWDQNVGARILYQLCSFTGLSQKVLKLD